MRGRASGCGSTSATRCAMLVKNYEDETLARAFPAAVALSLYRALARVDVDPARFRARRAAAARAWSAAGGRGGASDRARDLGRWMPALLPSAPRFRRGGTDPICELAPLFGDPFQLHDVDDHYVATAQR